LVATTDRQTAKKGNIEQGKTIQVEGGSKATKRTGKEKRIAGEREAFADAL
jgi:hypothetical protein